MIRTAIDQTDRSHAPRRLTQRVLPFLLLFLIGPLADAADTADTNLYDTFELRIERPEIRGNRFEVFADVTFTNGAESYRVDGFYDGEDTWRARFIPKTPGKWNYAWRLGDASGTGTFVCGEKPAPRNRGPLSVAEEGPARLLYADGGAYYAFGGKRFSANNYGPAQKREGVIRAAEVNPEVLTLDQLSKYLDTMVANGLNTAYLQISLFPLEDEDEWDLNWIRRGERFVREMGRRGIYCQVNFFSAQARHGETFFRSSGSAEDHLFDAWDPQSAELARNYIRTIVARFGGYYNVYWELGDEIASRYEKPGNHRSFRNLANGQYLPWIREFDPYDRPVGCSFLRSKRGDDRDRSGDKYVESFAVDVWFPHDEGELRRWKDWGVPLIVNAPESFGGATSLGLDDRIRDPENLVHYRSALWLSLLSGADGCFTGSWLNITRRSDDTVAAQLEYQRSLRNFIARLPQPYFDLEPVEGPVVRGPVAEETLVANPNLRSRPTTLVPATEQVAAAAGEQLFLTLFQGATEEGDIELALPEGSYLVAWIDPATGGQISDGGIVVGGGEEPALIAHPAWEEDCLLMLVRDDPEAGDEAAEEATAAEDAPATDGAGESGNEA